MIAVGKAKGLEVGEQQLDGRARTVDDPLLYVGQDGRVETATIRIKQFLLRFVRTVVGNATGQPRIQANCIRYMTAGRCGRRRE